MPRPARQLSWWLLGPLLFALGGYSPLHGQAKVASFQNSQKGLNQQFERLLRACPNRETACFERELEIFSLREPAIWFARHFDPESARQLGAEYPHEFARFQQAFIKIVEDLQRQQLKLKKIDAQEAGTIEPMPGGLKRPVPTQPIELQVFRPRFTANRDLLPSIGPALILVHEQGAFRLLGSRGYAFWLSPRRVNLDDLPEKPVPSKPFDGKYPSLASVARIQDTVSLQVVIGPEGLVEVIGVVAGHPILVPAAIDAVRAWRFHPISLENEPVEVMAIVDVTFALQRRPAARLLARQ